MNADPVDTLALEQRLVVGGALGRVPPPGAYHWDTILALAARHRATTLLHPAWGDADDTVPAWVRERLAALYKEWGAIGIVMRWQRDDAIERLTAAGIPSLVLKGSALAARWYGDIGLRPVGDIDMLVEPDRIADATQVLVAGGYRQAERERGVDRSPHHATPLILPGMPLAVELHRALSPLLPVTPTFATLRGRSVPADDPPGIALTLAPEDMLFHLCLHLLQDFKALGWQVGRLLDVQRHLRTFALDWDRFAALTDDYSARDAARAALALTALVAGAAVPPSQTAPGAGELLLPYPAGIEIESVGLAHLAAALTERNAAEVWRLLSALPHSRHPHAAGEPAWRRVAALTVRVRDLLRSGGLRSLPARGALPGFGHPQERERLVRRLLP